MKSKLLLLTIFFFAVLLSYCVQPPVEEEQIILKFAGNLPVEHHVTKNMEYFAQLIENKTNGKVKVEVYPAGQLYSDKDLIRAVPSGAVDMAEITISQWSGKSPLFMFTDLTIYKSRDHWDRVMDNETVKEILSKEFEKAGVKLLYLMDYGYGYFVLKKPVYSLRDLQGLKIRGYSEVTNMAIKAVGASPVFLGAGEMYMALQTGTIDGVLTGPTSILHRKLYEVAPYALYEPVGYAEFAVVMNLDRWNSLPPDVQKIIMECAKEAREHSKQISRQWDEKTEEILKNEKNMTFTRFKSEKDREEFYRLMKEEVTKYFLERAKEYGKEEEAKKLLSIAEALGGR